MGDRFFDLMIMTDLDGTFLGHGSEVVGRNLEAVERFKSEGGLFTFATGRTFANLFTTIPDTDKIVNAPLSLGNGCCMYDAQSRRPIADFFLKPGVGLDVAKYLRGAYPDLGVRVSDSYGFLYEPDDEVVSYNLRRVGWDDKRTLPMSEWEDSGWYKIVVIGDSDRLEEVRADCAARYGNAFGYDKSGKRLFEIHRADRSKASMIDTFKELYLPERGKIKVCAVGDYENDIDMLKKADIAACPSNATDAVKAISDLCLCSNNEGVIGDLVEYFETNYNK